MQSLDKNTDFFLTDETTASNLLNTSKYITHLKILSDKSSASVIKRVYASRELANS